MDRPKPPSIFSPSPLAGEREDDLLLVSRVRGSEGDPCCLLMKVLLILCAICVIAACDTIPPSPTPTRALSGPTLEPSPTILPLMQAQMPTQLLYVGQDDP